MPLQISQGQDQFIPMVWGPGLQSSRLKAALECLLMTFLWQLLDCQARLAEGG